MDRGIDERLRQPPGSDRRRHAVDVDGVGHVDVNACSKGKNSGLHARGRDAVIHHLCDAVVVADHDTLESPEAAQHVTQQPIARVRGSSADIVERGHDDRGARFDCCLVGGQVGLPQRALREFHRVVVAPAFCPAVGRKVLGGRQQRVGRAEVHCVVPALEPAHSCCGHRCA